MAKIVGLIVVLFGLFALFGVIEHVWGAKKPAAFRRQGAATDAAFWFFTSLVTRTLGRVAIALVMVPFLLASGARLDGFGAWFEARKSGAASVLGLPLWAEAMLALVIFDLIGYWMHRAFHRGWLWRSHAVHHSSIELDWLSSVRLHPINEMLTRAAQALPLLLLGFRPGVLASVGPFFSLYALLIHANVPWTFGPLRFVIASPTFHRWHHSADQATRGRNFAGLFPVWDLLFGTFFMPPGPASQRFGVGDEPMPRGFLGLLAHPFRAKAVNS